MAYVKSDCLDYIKTLKENSVDLIITDPPYYIGFDRGKGWDSQWENEKEYLSWCSKWVKECVRVLKPNRMLVVWGTLKTETFLKFKLETSKLVSLFPQNEIIWSYNWGGRDKSNFARKHEYAWCWSKGEKFLFNSEDVLQPRKLKKNLRTGEKYSKGSIPTSVWEKNNHTTSKDYIGWHPTTKNLDVLTRIIRAYSNEKDTIMDIFMGSGSTAIAAIRNGRNIIGCESDEEFYNLSCERIQKEKKHKTK